MRFEVFSAASDIAALAGEWEQLVGGVEDGIFLSYDWLQPWWRIYGAPRGAELMVVALRETTGALAGIAPLYFTPQDATLRFLGSGGDTSPDYLTVLARPGREREVAATLVRALSGAAAPPWHGLLLTDMAEDAAMTWALEQALRRQGVLVRRVENSMCPYVALAGSAAEQQARLRGKQRYNVESRRRKLAAQGVRFVRWEREGDVAAGMEHLAALHRQRFGARGVPHAFSSPEYLSFHHEVAARLHARGELRLYALVAPGAAGAPGAPVAMLYCFRRGGRVYHFQSGFDPAWRRSGVGQVLLAEALASAAEEGARYFDFLKGEYAYKEDWATGRRRTVRLAAARATVRGVLHLGRAWARPVLGPFVRRLAKEGSAALLEGRNRREVAKHALATALYHTGALGLALGVLRRIEGRRGGRGGHLIVLAYHKVLPSAMAGEHDALSAVTLGDQARALDRLFAVVGPDEAMAELAGTRRGSRYPVLLTFDDGYDNARLHAAPLLQATGAGLPALFFVSTGLVGTDEFLWPDEVTALLLGSPASKLHLPIGRALAVHRLGDAHERLRLASEIKRHLKCLPYPAFRQKLDDLRAGAGLVELRPGAGPGLKPGDDTRLMDWDGVRQCQERGMHIGSHAACHLILSHLSDELLEREVAGSQEALVQHLDLGPEGKVRYFAYPNGTAQDIDARVLREVTAAGFTHAFTMEPRVASALDHPLLLPRIAPQDQPGKVLAFELVLALARQVLRPAAAARAAESAAARVLGPRVRLVGETAAVANLWPKEVAPEEQKEVLESVVSHGQGGPP
jgi:CelD/BcsL family acetyltransferase involved in cellulose biosynthesis/peptidoglycan/xylan/chitin deacetylase (PgdA/CDA1 family)